MEQHHFLRHYELQPELQSNRNIHTIDLNGQISQPVSYFNPIAPDDGANLQWNSGFERERKRLKEHDFLENITQISCVDFMGLSRDNNTSMASTGDSASLSLLRDGNIDRQLLQQDAEIDRFLRLQSDRLRETILEKVRATQLQNISIIEDKVLQKLREKEAEVESINKRNIELEEQMQQLATEADIWQQRARSNESMVAALKFNLEQVYAQSRDCKEGCGDSEVDDAASCFNGHSIDFHLLTRGNNNMKDMMTCKACKVNEVTMLLLPCKHLCLCKDCESKLSFCPLCQSSKFIGVEVYM
ncbi:Zinc finger, RING-type [Sesbania bispinosa]|nr:Zinc finger, RING-type [Sesbania bispinosa]